MNTTTVNLTSHSHRMPRESTLEADDFRRHRAVLDAQFYPGRLLVLVVVRFVPDDVPLARSVSVAPAGGSSQIRRHSKPHARSRNLSPRLMRTWRGTAWPGRGRKIKWKSGTASCTAASSPYQRPP